MTAGLLMFKLLMAVSGAATQALPVRQDCVVVGMGDTRKSPNLHVACGQIGVRLGRVDGYETSYNTELRALAVLSLDRDVQRLRLITMSRDGFPHVDDLTRELAKLAGEIPDGGLRSNRYLNIWQDRNGLVFTERHRRSGRRRKVRDVGLTSLRD